MSHYVDNFINNTSHFQINDARQAPIIIPSEGHLKIFKMLFQKAYEIKRKKFSSEISEEKADELLQIIQKELDMAVETLYAI